MNNDDDPYNCYEEGMRIKMSYVTASYLIDNPYDVYAHDKYSEFAHTNSAYDDDDEQ